MSNTQSVLDFVTLRSGFEGIAISDSNLKQADFQQWSEAIIEEIIQLIKTNSDVKEIWEDEIFEGEPVEPTLQSIFSKECTDMLQGYHG